MTAAGIQAFLLAFPALFSIVNPFAGAIIFNQVTAAQTHRERVALARGVAVYSMLVMLVALWGGVYVLSFFGISLDALRIAGGIVVAVRAYEMLSAPEERAERKEAETAPVNRASAALADYAFSRSLCRLPPARAPSPSRSHWVPSARSRCCRR